MSSSRLRTHFERLGECAGIGIDGDRPWDIRVHDERIYQRVLGDGTLGLGEAYMDGWWDCDALDELVLHGRASDLPAKLTCRPRCVRVARPSSSTSRSRRRRAFEIGEHHYDIGNDLYEAMLDRRMIYTCAYWHNASTLEQAQEPKLDLVCRKLGLEPACACSTSAAAGAARRSSPRRRYGVAVTGVTRLGGAGGARTRALCAAGPSRSGSTTIASARGVTTGSTRWA